MDNKLTIKDLLNALKNPDSVKSDKPQLAATKENYSRMATGDKFAELGLEGSELEEFLKEWAKENPYSNL